MGQLSSCFFVDHRSNEDRDDSRDNDHARSSRGVEVRNCASKNGQPKTYKDVSDGFMESMRNHRERDGCAGFRFHKSDPCYRCMGIAIKADFENRYYQPGGPYGFTKTGFDFSMEGYYDNDNPEPRISPYCPKHLRTLGPTVRGYERCYENTPLCPNQVGKSKADIIARTHSY